MGAVGAVGQVSRARVLRGYVLACLLPVLVAGVLFPLRDALSLVSDALLLLLSVVVAALVGGLVPGLLAGVVATALLNFLFTPPFHTLRVASADNLVSLAVFATAAVLVSWALDQVERRRRETVRAAALEAATDVRTALLAAAGHDLRTPLAAAKAAISGLRSEDVELDEADQRDLLWSADASLDKLSGLVTNLLDLSRLQLGAVPVVRRPTPVDEVVVRALDEVSVPVVVDVPDDLPDALADAGLLERVLANLLTNAVRQPAPQRTAVVCRAHDGVVEVSVVDHGQGVPQDRWDTLFTAFQRQGDTSNTEGLGLGLAASRGLVEAMGGTLAPQHTPGGGLTMTVRLEVAGD
jgi:two-component system sensor histidine kinase KdpD